MVAAAVAVLVAVDLLVGFIMTGCVCVLDDDQSSVVVDFSRRMCLTSNSMMELDDCLLLVTCLPSYL
jgi:hypothetical protein